MPAQSEGCGRTSSARELRRPSGPSMVTVAEGDEQAGAPLAPIQDDVSDSDLAEAVGSAETLQVLMAVRLMQRGVPALAYVGIKADLEARFGQPAFERAKAHVQRSGYQQQLE